MKNKLMEFIDGHADQWGVWLSLVCLIHCMAIPLLLIFAPVLAMYFKHQIIHTLLLIMIAPLVYTSLSHLKAGKTHRYVLFIGPIGITFLAVALGIEIFTHHHHSLYGEILSTIGSICLIIFHWHNYKVRKQQTTCCKTDIAH